MGNDLSIWTLVLDASPIVQAVMVLLMAASVASWAIILKKSSVISHSRRQADRFETAFWSGGDLSTLYRSIETKGREGTGGGEDGGWWMTYFTPAALRGRRWMLCWITAGRSEWTCAS